MAVISGTDLSKEIMDALGFPWRGHKVVGFKLSCFVGDVATMKVTHFIDTDDIENIKKVMDKYKLVEKDGEKEK